MDDKLELNKKEIINSNGFDSFTDLSIPDEMFKDAFAALTISILKEFMMSSDSKYFLFQGMLYNLEKMGYTKEEMENFTSCMDVAFKKFHKPNDFMG